MAAQDMPPPGGFASIKWQRTFSKPLLRQSVWAALLVAGTANGIYLCHVKKRKRNILRAEQVEHQVAVSPFLYAEAERKFLINLYNIREYERNLMKDYPGWKLGTLFGERPFKTIPPNELPPISDVEFAIARTRNEWMSNAVLCDFNH